MMQLSVSLSCVLLIGIAWWKLNAYVFGDILSPFNILLFFWIAPFIISFSGLSDLQQGIATGPLVTILMATGVMIVTLTVPNLFAIQVPRSPLDRGAKFGVTTGTIDRLVLMSFVLVLVALIVKIYTEFSDGIPLFAYLDSTKSSAILHRFGKDSKLQIFAQMLPIGGLLSWYCVLQASGRPVVRVLAVLLAFIPLVAGIMKTSKSDIIEPIFLYLIIYYYLRPGSWRVCKIKFLALAVMSIMALWCVTEIRLSGQHSVIYADAIAFDAKRLLGGGESCLHTRTDIWYLISKISVVTMHWPIMSCGWGLRCSGRYFHLS